MQTKFKRCYYLTQAVMSFVNVYLILKLDQSINLNILQQKSAFICVALQTHIIIFSLEILKLRIKKTVN